MVDIGATPPDIVAGSIEARANNLGLGRFA
jgi:hypothetical protein